MMIGMEKSLGKLEVNAVKRAIILVVTKLSPPFWIQEQIEGMQ